jgi:cytidylate kinase
VAGALRGVVALDGPSGTGKTTVAQKLAARLGAGYLDTGAMYRVITLAVLRAGVDPADSAAVARLADAVRIDVETDPARPRALLDGDDVTAEIRGEAVNQAVSPVAAVGQVRELLVAQQRRLIGQVLETTGGIVVDGRDIGTVVAPDAGLKVFLTASPEVRAARRSAQDLAAGRDSTQQSAQASVERRDRLDSTRTASPMRPADDAVEVDTSDLGIEQVLTALTELAGVRGLLGGAAPAELES